MVAVAPLLLAVSMPLEAKCARVPVGFANVTGREVWIFDRGLLGIAKGYVYRSASLARKLFVTVHRQSRCTTPSTRGAAHTHIHTHIQEPIRVHDLEFQFRKGYTQFAI